MLLLEGPRRRLSIDAEPRGTDRWTGQDAAAQSALDRTEDRAVLRERVAALTDRQRSLLALRFVWDQSQRQIAERLGISQMHVSRTLRATLATLRQQIE
jgi:RNA polymerase sigma-B factor